MGKRIVQGVAVVGLISAIGTVIVRFGIPRLRQARDGDSGHTAPEATLYDDEMMGSDDGAADTTPSTEISGPRPQRMRSRGDAADPAEPASNEADEDLNEDIDSAQPPHMRFVRSWHLGERWHKALWIALGTLFVVMGAFSAHASWRDYDGLATGFVILAVFSSVSVALSRDSVAAATKMPLSKDPTRLLTDDTLRLLTLTVLGVLCAALYPLVPAVRHLVAFFAGGALSVATASAVVLLIQNVDIGAMLRLRDE